MTPRTSLLASVLVLACAGTAAARPRPSGHIGGKRFEANNTFGLGLELGAPFGLTGKYFLAPDRALDFGIGWIDYYYHDRYGVNFYGDYLWHPVSFVSTESFELPFYIGVGARIWHFDDRRVTGQSGDAFGVRVPAGVSFDLNNVPLDIFGQLTFVVDFFHNGPHNVYPGIEGSVGIRYWFN